MPVAASYTAILGGMPPEYSYAGARKTVSPSIVPGSVAMGTIILLPKPILDVSLRHRGGPAPGQTIRVTNGVWTLDIPEGSTDDVDGVIRADGRIRVRVPYATDYTVCAITTPEPHWETGCETVQVLLYFTTWPVTLTYEPSAAPIPGPAY
jgi:hypothetical protein